MAWPTFHLPTFLLFASDAMLAALVGAGLLALALAALLAERLRDSRARIERVGWVPWTTLFVLCAMSGAGLLVLGIRGLLSG